jgi:hypothetical protein
VGRDKLLIPNPDNKGKDRTESASSKPIPRVLSCHLPPKINSPSETMEFSDDKIEEEKEELSNELMACNTHFFFKNKILCK